MRLPLFKKIIRHISGSMNKENNRSVFPIIGTTMISPYKKKKKKLWSHLVKMPCEAPVAKLNGTNQGMYNKK